MKLLASYRPLLLILFVIAGNIAAAQDTATSRFIDSASTPVQPVQDSTAVIIDSAVSSEASDDTAELPVDTAITSNLRQIHADTIARIKKDKGFYYQQWLDSILRAEDAKIKAAKPPRKLNMPNLGAFFTVFQVVLWLLAGAVLLFILYKLFLGKNALFLKNRKNIDAIINVKEEEIPASRYEAMIKKAEAESNYRLAVRYLHLQALYNLSQKGYVQLATEKTNYQYINELRKRPANMASIFANLTNKYEYIWYGEYPISNTMYVSLRNEFVNFAKQTGSY